MGEACEVRRTYSSVRFQADQNVAEDTKENHLILEAGPDLSQVDKLRVDLCSWNSSFWLDGSLELLHTCSQLWFEHLHLLGAADHIMLRENEKQRNSHNIIIGKQAAKHNTCITKNM